ncbi:Cysteine synthase 1 [Lamellibrachia satsuma]|nr:Cysteine synthase 1 [Lamellibrachia satsuma]
MASQKFGGLVQMVPIFCGLRAIPVRCVSHKASRVKSGFMGLTGGTPLVRLNQMSDETGCEILAKAEYLNGGGSVKDRPALYLIKEAISSGKLRPGGTIIEGTAGNTGIGLAYMANSMGFKCIFFIPEIMSQNDILEMLDGRRGVILVLLDMSAAFDTVDHEILLSRLEQRFRMSGPALMWMQSYLPERSQLRSATNNDLYVPPSLLFQVAFSYKQ